MDLFLRVLAGSWDEGNRFTALGTDSLGRVQIWRCASCSGTKKQMAIFVPVQENSFRSLDCGRIIIAVFSLTNPGERALGPLFCCQGRKPLFLHRPSVSLVSSHDFRLFQHGILRRTGQTGDLTHPIVGCQQAQSLIIIRIR